MTVLGYSKESLTVKVNFRDELTNQKIRALEVWNRNGIWEWDTKHWSPIKSTMVPAT